MKKNSVSSWPKPHRFVLNIQSIRTDYQCHIAYHIVNLIPILKFLFSFDCFGFYLQLSCVSKSCTYFTIVTSNGLWTPTQVIIKATDADAFYQQVIEQVFFLSVLQRGAQAWMDDIVGHTIGELQLLKLLKLCSCDEKYLT